jgi:hypothetical protein
MLIQEYVRDRQIFLNRLLEIYKDRIIKNSPLDTTIYETFGEVVKELSEYDIFTGLMVLIIPIKIFDSATRDLKRLTAKSYLYPFKYIYKKYLKISELLGNCMRQLDLGEMVLFFDSIDNLDVLVYNDLSNGIQYRLDQLDKFLGY